MINNDIIILDDIFWKQQCSVILIHVHLFSCILVSGAAYGDTGLAFNKYLAINIDNTTDKHDIILIVIEPSNLCYSISNFRRLYTILRFNYRPLYCYKYLF